MCPKSDLKFNLWSIRFASQWLWITTSPKVSLLSPFIMIWVPTKIQPWEIILAGHPNANSEVPNVYVFSSSLFLKIETYQFFYDLNFCKKQIKLHHISPCLTLYLQNWNLGKHFCSDNILGTFLFSQNVRRKHFWGPVKISVEHQTLKEKHQD